MSGIQQMVSASSGLASHMGSVAGSMGSGFLSIGSSIVGAVEGIGRFVFFARSAIDGAMGFGNALFGTNAQMEQARTAFTGLLGSGTAADAMLRRLWSFAASTPFEFPELVQDTQELVGMGFAANDVIPVLTAVGDAAAGVGRGQEGVERITLALGQMQARGKVTGQDMLQLTEAGIPAWKILADSMGLSVAQVQKLSEQGKLGAGSVTALYQGMEKMYGGQMAGQAQTFNGLLSTLHDNANMALATFSGPLFAMAKGSLQQLTAMVGSPAFSAFAKSLGQEVASGLSNLIRGVQQAVGWFGQFGPQVAQVGAAFNNLGAALAPIVQHFQQTGTAGQLANAALSLLRGVITGLAGGFAGLINGLAQVIRWLGQFGPLVGQIGAAFGNLGAALGNLGAALGRIAGLFQQSGAAAQAANGTLSLLHATITILLTGVTTLVNGLTRIVQGATQIASSFQQAATTTNSLRSAIAQVQTVLTALGVLLAVGATSWLLWQGAVMLAGLMSAMSVTSIFALVPALIADGTAAAGSAIVFAASLVPAFIATTVAALGTAAAVIAATWPFLLIGAAIALAVVGLILLYTNCAPVRAAVASIVTTAQQLWNTLMSNLAPAFAQVGASLGRLGAAFGEMLNALRPAAPLVMVLGAVLGGVLAVALGLVIGALMGIVTGLGYFIAGLTMVLTGIIMVFTGIITFISGFFTVIVGICTLNTATIQQGFASMGAGISQIVSGALTAIEGLFVAVFGTIFGIVVGFVQGVITFFENLYHALVGGSIVPDMCNAILSAFQTMVSVVTAVISGFVAIITAIFSVMAAVVEVVWQTLVSVVENVVQGFVDLITGNFQGFQASVLNIFNALKDGAINIWNALKDGAVNVASALVSGVMGIWNALPGNVQGVFNSMKDNALGVLNSLASMAFTAAANIGSSIVSGLNSMLGAIGGAAQNIAGAIASFLPHSPAEQGPLARLDEFGPAVPAMFAAGIVAGIPQVQAAVNMMVSPVPSATAGSVNASGVATVSTSGTASGRRDAREMIDVLTRIERKLDSGRRVTREELVQAMGSTLSERVQQYRR